MWFFFCNLLLWMATKKQMQTPKIVLLPELHSFTTHFDSHGAKVSRICFSNFCQKRVSDKKTLENDIFFHYFDDFCRRAQFLLWPWKQNLVYKINIYHINFCMKGLKRLLNEWISLNHSHFQVTVRKVPNFLSNFMFDKIGLMHP